MDMSNVEKKLGHGISGAIISDGTKSQIKINCHDNPARQIFTIAHELGHKLLHIQDGADGVIVSFRSLKNEREREADAFAAELLMPDDLVMKEYNKLFYPLVSQLAETFNVSQSAMKYKLNELGLIYIG
jgi:Zn-dependent peptidase ImmA (M78 family)